MGEWFDTGLKMANKKTPRTVYAKDGIQSEEFLKKGWTVAKQKAVVKKKAAVKKKVPRRSFALKKSANADNDE